MRAAVLIDGGFLRALARKDRKDYNPDFIERFGHACKSADETITRILYYDCGEFTGTVTLPVSGQKKEFKANDTWLHELSHKDLFAVRRGQLKFRGYVRKRDDKPNGNSLVKELLAHADFTRSVTFP